MNNSRGIWSLLEATGSPGFISMCFSANYINA